MARMLVNIIHMRTGHVNHIPFLLSLIEMEVEELIAAAEGLRLTPFCCSRCCIPRYVSYPDDPSPDALSRMSKRKFYIVKKGDLDGEAIYSHWELAKSHVLGASNASHISCKTWEEALTIWVRNCHQHHGHSTIAPPPYETAQPASSWMPPPIPVRTPASPVHASVSPPSRTPLCMPMSPVRAPVSPRIPVCTPVSPRAPGKLYRVAGSPRVFVIRAAAEAELQSTGATSVLVGTLEQVEDDNGGTGSRYYRVFGSPRVQINRADAMGELMSMGAAELLVGNTLAEVEP
ncbi:hypothetical protein B0H17DRAFT_1200010 [Mycena rosella]|uniref:Ribonuclease H1 N-terminal domain-containing protein n=1 Tax=Mycena rosella TaxID=1033263 RepID=A0AAD7DJG6_MYCRO|nr:hypothetical protein B0H17DRAFT_1200010 [Mycena rosella]